MRRRGNKLPWVLAGSCEEGTAVAQNTDTDQDPITIKKYANRRLYNTATSTYVTLEDLCEMVKKGNDFLVFNGKAHIIYGPYPFFPVAENHGDIRSSKNTGFRLHSHIAPAFPPPGGSPVFWIYMLPAPPGSALRTGTL